MRLFPFLHNSEFAEIFQEMRPESHRSELKPIWPSTTGWQLMGHDAASLQAADPPRQRVSELVAHADTASLLSLMWSAMPQKKWNFWVHFLGPENGPEFVPRGQKRDPKLVPEPGVTKSMFFHTKSELYLAESDTKTSKLILSVSGFIPTGSTQIHVPNDPPKRQL